MRIEQIRNFCIIAHIDHGKSTLADRFLLLTGAISQREFRDQVLDDMDLERERGITIKARAVTLDYSTGGQDYQLNLIDTPGHVDFSYEVSRSLSAAEGSLLLVDASQGVEAQTVANTYLAMEHDHRIIPVINKIDLSQARPDEVAEQAKHILGVDDRDVLRVSAKTGVGVPEILEAVVKRIPPPEGDPDAPLQALIFDSLFDDYRGVINYIRVMNGTVKTGDMVHLIKSGGTHPVNEIGRFRPNMTPCDSLSAGEVGYLICGIKGLTEVKIGDTITGANEKDVPALPGYREPRPMVFCGLYPTAQHDVNELRIALERLSLNDSAFTFEPESSAALGFGFRCGFLGLLHMEIVQERLERESEVEVVQTAPSVTYQILTTTGETRTIHNPSEIPDANYIEEFREPIVRVSLIMPGEYIGPVMKLCEDRRGKYKRTEYLSPTRVLIEYELPLAEIVYDFHDRLKSATRGYGTMDYEFAEYEAGDLVKLDILVAGQIVDALSLIVHKDKAYFKGRKLVQRLRKEIDRHLFEISIQAAIGSRVIARETIKPLLKNVIAKCYGGDVSRKRKLLEKQKEGKKRMKQVGRVSIPQEAFLAVLRDME